MVEAGEPADARQEPRTEGPALSSSTSPNSRVYCRPARCGGAGSSASTASPMRLLSWRCRGAPGWRRGPQLVDDVRLGRVGGAAVVADVLGGQEDPTAEVAEGRGRRGRRPAPSGSRRWPPGVGSAQRAAGSRRGRGRPPAGRGPPGRRGAWPAPSSPAPDARRRARVGVGASGRVARCGTRGRCGRWCRVAAVDGVGEAGVSAAARRGRAPPGVSVKRGAGRMGTPWGVAGGPRSGGECSESAQRAGPRRRRWGRDRPRG